MPDGDENNTEETPRPAGAFTFRTGDGTVEAANLSNDGELENRLMTQEPTDPNALVRVIYTDPDTGGLAQGRVRAGQVRGYAERAALTGTTFRVATGSTSGLEAAGDISEAEAREAYHEELDGRDLQTLMLSAGRSLDLFSLVLGTGPTDLIMTDEDRQMHADLASVNTTANLGGIAGSMLLSLGAGGMSRLAGGTRSAATGGVGLSFLRGAAGGPLGLATAAGTQTARASRWLAQGLGLQRGAGAAGYLGGRLAENMAASYAFHNINARIHQEPEVSAENVLIDGGLGVMFDMALGGLGRLGRAALNRAGKTPGGRLVFGRHLDEMTDGPVTAQQVGQRMVRNPETVQVNFGSARERQALFRTDEAMDEAAGTFATRINDIASGHTRIMSRLDDYGEMAGGFRRAMREVDTEAVRGAAQTAATSMFEKFDDAFRVGRPSARVGQPPKRGISPDQVAMYNSGREAVLDFSESLQSARSASAIHEGLFRLGNKLDDIAKGKGDDALLIREQRAFVDDVLGNTAVFGRAGKLYKARARFLTDSKIELEQLRTSTGASADGVVSTDRLRKGFKDFENPQGDQLVDSLSDYSVRLSNNLDEMEDLVSTGSLRESANKVADDVSRHAEDISIRARLAQVARAEAEKAKSGLMGDFRNLMRIPFVGSAIGGALGGVTGGLAGSLGQAAFKGFTRPAQTVQRIVEYGRAFDRVTGRIGAANKALDIALRSGSRVISGQGAIRKVALPATLETLRNTSSAVDQGKALTEITTRLEQLALNPEMMSDRFSVLQESLGEENPHVGTAAVATAVRATNHLFKHLPRGRNDPLMPTRLAAPPSRSSIDGFVSRYEAIVDPISVYENLIGGAITKEHVDALREVYPMMYQQLQTQALQTVSAVLADEDEVSYQMRLHLGTFLGGKFDVSLEPDSILRLQSNFAQTPEASNVLGSNGFRPSQGRVGISNMTQLDTTRLEGAL